MKKVLIKKLKKIYRIIGMKIPTIYFVILYYRAAKIMGDSVKERDFHFNKMIADSANKKCLQIGVKEQYGAKFGENWVSVDKYDKRDFIDYHYGIHDMNFEDNTFDVAICVSVLEHVSHPEKAIAELTRVLKPGGQIWIQLPFQYFYHEAPKDYWRASPDGLRVWLSGYDEIYCGSFNWAKTALATSSFFYGTKKKNST